MTRRPLPARRRNATAEATWQNHAFTVTVGFDDHGAPMEVFCNHAKGDMAATLADACIVLSIALQHGVTPDALGKSLGSVPEWINGAEAQAPASPIGTIIAEIRKAADHG